MNVSLIDVNIALGNWPFQRFDVRTPAKLAAHLENHGISGGWVSALDSVLYPDPDVTDLALRKQMNKTTTLVFAKTLNPVLANWEKSLCSWIDEYDLRLVKIFPSYHGYGLPERGPSRLGEKLASAGIPLMIQMRLEDERGQYPMMPVPPVPPGDIVAFCRRFPGLQVIVLGAYSRELGPLSEGTENLHVDISFVESLETIKDALDKIPSDRVLFGSFTPLFYTSAALMKLEHADIDPEQLKSVASGNALRILRACRQ